MIVPAVGEMLSRWGGRNLKQTKTQAVSQGPEKGPVTATRQ